MDSYFLIAVIPHRDGHEFLRAFYLIESRESAKSMWEMFRVEPEGDPLFPGVKWLHLSADVFPLHFRIIFHQEVELLRLLASAHGSVLADFLPRSRETQFLIKCHQMAKALEPAVLDGLRRRKDRRKRRGDKGAASKAEAGEKGLPKRAQAAHSQYLQAMPRCMGENGRVPSDRQCYDWLKAHNDGDTLPAFDSWQRYLRQARTILGTQKSAPRAGRPEKRTKPDTPEKSARIS
jgi:hypothetical protein